MASDENDVEFDARALFRHLIDDLGGTAEDEHDWTFGFSHPNSAYLQTRIEAFADFLVDTLSIAPDEVVLTFDDAPTAEDVDGRVVETRPRRDARVHRPNHRARARSPPHRFPAPVEAGRGSVRGRPLLLITRRVGGPG